MPTSNWFASLQAGEKAELVREAYKKHAIELLALEDAQQKVMLVLLAVLSAGASFIGAQKELALTIGARIGLSGTVMALVFFGMLYTRRRDVARQLTRQFLVNCEEAMGFWEMGAYVPDKPLYPGNAQDFVKGGRWLGATVWLVAIAGLGFLVLLCALPLPPK
jgi:hypothetical protein